MNRSPERAALAKAHKIYESATLLDQNDPAHEEIKRSFFGVLDALNVKYGPAHGELIVTPSGPALVEVAARSAGAYFPKLVQSCTGYS